MFLGGNLDQIYIGLDDGHVISNVAFQPPTTTCVTWRRIVARRTGSQPRFIVIHEDLFRPEGLP